MLLRGPRRRSHQSSHQFVVFLALLIAACSVHSSYLVHSTLSSMMHVMCLIVSCVPYS